MTGFGRRREGTVRLHHAGPLWCLPPRAGARPQGAGDIRPPVRSRCADTGRDGGPVRHHRVHTGRARGARR